MSDTTTPAAELPSERVAELVAEGAQLVDVRRADEWEAGRIAGARQIEMNELPASAEELDRERPVIFYCRTGNRSSMAVDAFREAGFEAYNLAGGIEAWVAEGRELEPQGGIVEPPLPAS